MNRARGWRRIGIVLSTIWFLGFGMFLWSNEVQRIGDVYSWQYKMCYAGENIRNESLQYAKDDQEREKRRSENDAETKECKAQALAFHHSQWDKTRNAVWILFAVDSASVLLGWLVVWFIVLVVRWIQRGFAPV